MRQRLSRLLASLVRFVCRAALRAVVTCLIFTTSLAVGSSYLGLPVPHPSKLLQRFESVSQLAELLSLR